MLPEVKQRWIEALRSGKFKQGKAVLYNAKENSYCCLGVLCKVENLQTQLSFGAVMFIYKDTRRNSSVQIPTDFAEIIKIDIETQAKLANLNDEHNKSFEEIADYIEQNL